ncbi:MAG TPA: hypothetical protein VE995_04900, partial [Gaiellaceae bacterium]|nr:hypothetical protein [Gaiellaceae bacterium]
GALHVSFGERPATRAAPAQLRLPRGAAGLAALVDGRLSVAMRGGFRLQGLRASAVALSPHALYVAAGVGDALVAMAPDGRLAWSRPAGGRVVAIAWAPDGLRIAYVVRNGRGLLLRLVWGNGTHDAVVDRDVRPVTPSWRSDSLALAYVGGGGRAVVYDLGHGSRSVVGRAAPVAALAFAPAGGMLLAATRDAVFAGARRLARGEVEAVGWLGGRPAAALAAGKEAARVGTLGRPSRPVERLRVPGVVLAIGDGVVVARTPGRLLAVRPSSPPEPLLRLQPGERVEALALRER